MARTLLLIPVPELAALLLPEPRGDRGGGHDPATPTHVPAFVSLVDPFAEVDSVDDGLLGELRSFFADVTPFEFHVTAHTTALPGGTQGDDTILVPAPATPFRRLTQELQRRFPECLPTAPRLRVIGEAVPRLRLPTDLPAAVLSGLVERLPIHAVARRAALVLPEPPAVRVTEVFPFGTVAA